MANPWEKYGGQEASDGPWNKYGKAAEQSAVASPKVEATSAEQIAGNPITRFALGAASPIIGGAQLLANVSPVSRMLGGDVAMNREVAQLEEMKRKGMAAAGNEGTDVAGIAGSVVNPAGWAVASKLAAPATMLGKIGQGAAIGAAYGATTPVEKPSEFFTEKGKQTAIGTAIGGIAPPAISAVASFIKGAGGTVRDIADLWLEGGPKRILTKYYDKILDKDPQTRQTIINALMNPPTYVKGSAPTAAEATAHIPEASPLVAYQDMLSRTPGGPSGKFAARTAQQEAARQSAIESISKDEPTRKLAEATRSFLADINYGNAYRQQINADPELARLVKDPFIKKAMPDAFELAQSRGVDPRKNLTEFLHFVKIGLDRQLLTTGENALTNTQKGAIASTQDKLIAWLGKKNPAYDYARETFANQSREIDRMNIGQVLGEKLVSATERETPASYAQAVRTAPQTIKRATGESRYDELSQILTPREIQQVNAIVADVTRKAKSINPQQRTNLRGGVDVAEAARPHGPTLWWRPSSIANWIASMRAGKIEPLVDELGTMAHLDPNTLASILRSIPPRQQSTLLDVLGKPNPATVGIPLSAISEGTR